MLSSLRDYTVRCLDEYIYLIEEKIIEHIPLNSPRSDWMNTISFFLENDLRFSYERQGIEDEDTFLDYFAGVVDGRGLIVIPNNPRSEETQKIIYPSIQFNMGPEEEPYLRALWSSVRLGNINRSGDFFRWTIIGLEDIKEFIQLINGRLRSNKIRDLERLLEWHNERILHSNEVKNIIKEIEEYQHAH